MAALLFFFALFFLLHRDFDDRLLIRAFWGDLLRSQWTFFSKCKRCEKS